MAVANVDAHVAVPAATVLEPGRMVIIMGTSNCHMVLGTEERDRARHVRLRGGWHHAGPARLRGRPILRGRSLRLVRRELRAGGLRARGAARGINIHQLLEEKAAQLKPGESGLLALDWWNGNRTVLVDVDLTGMLLGMTLATKPEEIYRALIEATAYGTRVIIETFEANGVPDQRDRRHRRAARPQQAADADLRRRHRPADCA